MDLFEKFINNKPLPCIPILSPYFIIGTSTLMILLIPFFLIFCKNVSFSKISKTGYHIMILDFEKVEEILNNIDNLFSNSKIIIWYPVLNILENDSFIQNIRKKGISNIINVEVPIMKYGDNVGMQGSGLLLINFSNRSIMKNLKEVIHEIQNILKQEENSTRFKLRYL